MAACAGPRRCDRALTAVTSPAVLLGCACGGAVAWAAGVPALSSVFVTGAMAAAAAVGAVTGAGASGPRAGRRGGAVRFRGKPSLRAGTEQARLAAEFDGQVGDLRSLRAWALLPDLLTDPAVEALVAADGASEVAVRVARAVDALDAALDRAHDVGQRVPPSPASAAVIARMYQRRERLLAALRDGLAQVQDVHAQLLELSATAGLPGLPGLPGLDDVAAEVREVGERIDLLRRSFAELDATASSALPRP